MYLPIFRSPAGLRAAALLGLVCLAGCSPDKEAVTPNTSTLPSGPPAPAPAGTTPKAGANVHIAYVTNSSSGFWTLARKGVEKAEKDMPNVTVDFVMPADGTAATQKSQIDDLLSKGVQGVAVDPVDPKNQTAYFNTVAAKIPLITFDSDDAASNRLCYIGSDNVAAGRMAGQMVKEVLPQGGKIMLFVGKRDAQNAQDREQGVRDALKGSNVTIVDVRTDDVDHARAKQNASDAMTSTPDIACLVGLWSYNGPAILSAVQEAGKVGKVKIVCFDDEAETLAGVKAGAIYGTVVQQPFQFGYQSVKTLSQIVGGDKSGIPANKLNIIPTQAIKKDGVDAFQAQVAKQQAGG